MNMKMFPALAIVAIVTALIFASMLPVFQEINDENTTLYNNTSESMAIISEGTHTINYNGTDKTISIDGVDRTPTAGRSISVFMSDDMNILFTDTATIQLFSNQHTNGIVSITNDMVVSIDGKEVNIEYGPSDNTVSEDYSIEWGYIYDPAGDYGLLRLYNTSKTVYVNNINDIRGSNILTTTNDWFSYVGANVETESGVVTEATYTLNEISGMDDVYSVSLGSNGTYSFDIDNNGTPYTVHPWVAIAPKDVMGVKEGTGPTLSIIQVIPLILAGCMVVGIAGVFISRKL